MKLFATLGLFFIINACVASPANYRFNLSPDGEGRMHLIDVNPVQVEVEPLFNPEADTAFLLFTRSNPTVAQRITWTTASIQNSNFNPAHPVRVAIHGWNSGPTSGAILSPRDAYLQLGDFNVIGVDWSVGANTINYISARNRVAPVGEVLARLLDFLVSNGFTTMNRVNICGHSLGGHIAGHAGKRVTQGRINAIFGLDTAGVLFSINSPADRLDVDDAVYTEGLHTNAGNLGFDVPITHAAFYPNWGSSQPGCGVDVSGNCAHSRAHALFGESIITDRFVAQQCNGYQEIVNRACTGAGRAVMGDEPANIGLRGVFFFQTNSNTPFAMG